MAVTATSECCVQHLPVSELSVNHEPAQARRAALEADRFSEGSCAVIDVHDVKFGKEIGKGSVARVYKAKLHSKRVAVKIVKVGDTREDTELNKRIEHLERELAAVSTGFHHPNLIQLVGAGKTESGLPMLVYELSEGGSAEELFSSKFLPCGGAWAPPRATSLSWCRQLFSALAFLHNLDSPLAHRDIKPANLLLSKDMKTLKLADFSLACALDDVTTHIAYVPSIAGSLRYMAPEIMTRKPFPLTKTDVYSATITSWALIHGQTPFRNIPHPAAAISHAIRGNRPFVEDPQLVGVLSAGWHASPSLRPPAHQMEEMFAALEAEVSASKVSMSARLLAKIKAFTSPGKTSSKLLAPEAAGSSAASPRGLNKVLQRTVEA